MVIVIQPSEKSNFDIELISKNRLGYKKSTIVTPEFPPATKTELKNGLVYRVFSADSLYETMFSFSNIQPGGV
ncbi:hypothetical protein RRG08_041322 [Elysia crispata]|uniref:Uncharacterized protein n=1 Tax=Elysia crispata TaxID=231223 RepID=A0AAE0YTH6_9GAST|nr:hypothetical protein RRG08_041322 [Elysia crispata]